MENQLLRDKQNLNVNLSCQVNHEIRSARQWVLDHLTYKNEKLFQHSLFLIVDWLVATIQQKRSNGEPLSAENLSRISGGLAVVTGSQVLVRAGTDENNAPFWTNQISVCVFFSNSFFIINTSDRKWLERPNERRPKTLLIQPRTRKFV